MLLLLLLPPPEQIRSVLVLVLGSSGPKETTSCTRFDSC
jgi:hypothetical protein